MSFMNRYMSVAAHRIGSVLRPAGLLFGLLTLCALASAAFLRDTEGGALPSARSVRVSFGGLDLSTPDGARDARERIRKAARDLCARNLGQRSLNWCVDEATAAAQQQIKARTTKVSLADLDLGTPQGVYAARGRLQATARRVCQELQTGSNVALTQYSACIDETFAHALRQADLLRADSMSFKESFKER